MATANPRFILLGGFLGAGKTTLIAQLAKHYISQGKRVGIVTNDQAADLVDTHTLRGQGFDVGEVAGACFCCSFNDLVATADRLDAEAKPDILLAEPVGSCTDLIATVIMPLEQLYTTKFEIAPYGVLLKPSHGRRILSSGKRSGFSPQAEYIFNKQLEEADFLMIGRADQLSEQEAEELAVSLRESAPGVPIVRVSPKTGAGVDDVIQQIENHEQRPHRVLEIDYDIYAEGEAELGWVNLSADLFAPNQIDLDRLVVDTVTGAGSAIAKAGGEIAHLKAAAMGDGIHAVANIVASGDKAEQALVAGREVAGQIQLIVNARVAMDPQELESIARAAVKESASHQLVETRDQHAHSLRPGRPVPTHRMS